MRRLALQLTVGLLLGFVTATWAGQTAGRAVTAAVTAHLTDVGAQARSNTELIEREQLALVRSIAYTEGVAEALAAKDVILLQQLAAPLQANSSIPIVNLVDTDGTIVLAIRSEGVPGPTSRQTDWRVVTDALTGDPSQAVERWSSLEITAAGPLITTAAPIPLTPTSNIGAATVAMPLPLVLRRLTANSTLVLTTIYSEQGILLASTDDSAPPALGPDLVQTVGGAARVGQRNFTLAGEDKMELLWPLIIQNQSVAILGIAANDASMVIRRSVIGLVAVGMVAAVMALGSLLGRLIYGRTQ